MLRHKDTPNMRSFTIATPDDFISIGNCRYSVVYMYKILFENGLRPTIPLQVHMSDQTQLAYHNVEWHPHNFQESQVYVFKWKDIECSITSNAKVAPAEKKVFIRVHDISHGVGERVIEDILKEIHSRFYVKPDPKAFDVYTTRANHGSYEWAKHGRRPNRSLETIYISEEQKTSIVTRLDKFYSSKSMYDKYCVPYKRVHLFHGEPGTGKTSTIVALATHFNKGIAKLTLSPHLTSQHLEYLFKSVPEKHFLVLEDVDALFKNRDANKDTGFDFSTLLNCMDGITTVKSLVVFMTTNHIDTLDPAFMRPGRIDMCVKFSAPSREAVLQCLRSLGEKYAHEHDEFMTRYGDKISSIAALQKHLFDCIMDELPTILERAPF